MIGFAMCGKPQFNGRYKHVKLVDVCEILDSKRIPITKNKRIAGPYPYYGANGIQDHVADFLFDDELVLLAEDGGHFEKDGQIAYRVSGKCWVNNHAHVLKAKNDVDIDYLCYALQSFDVSSLVNGATRKKLTQSAMKKITLPLRSVDVQLAIVNNLKTVEMQLANARKLLSSLDALVKSRFNEMLDRADNEFVSLGELAQSKMMPARKAYSDDDIIKYIDIGSIDNTAHLVLNCQPFRMGEAPSRAQQCVRQGDLLVSTVRPKLRNIALVDSAEDCLVASSGFCVLRSQNCPSEYLRAVVCDDRFTDEMCRLTTGANYPAIKATDVLGFKTPKLSMDDMSAFSTFVRQVDKLRFMLLANPSPAFGCRSFCCSTKSSSGGVILDT